MCACATPVIMTMSDVWYLMLWLICFCSGTGHGWDEDWPEAPDEFRLLHMLLQDYDLSVRPRFNSTDTVEVNVRFSLQQIYDLDEKRQILTISGWITAEWTDELLTWQPEDFGGLQSIIISPKKMWTPKLAIGNSATRMFYDWKHFWITVRPSGRCRWQPGGNFAFTCALDMSLYPFDEQSCTMELETWFYTAEKVILNSSMSEFGMETYLRHGEWTVVSTHVSQTNRVYGYYENEQFPEVYFTLNLRRKYTFYFMYILLPCIMLSFVLLMVFLLPAESGEKVNLGVSILVAFSVFLLIVAEKVPDNSDAVPVMAIYLMYFMMATALSVMTSTLILKLHYHGFNKHPPKWLRMVIFDLIAPVLCLGSIKSWNKRHSKCHHRRQASVSGKTADRTHSQANGDLRKQLKPPENGQSEAESSHMKLIKRTLSLDCLKGQPRLDQVFQVLAEPCKFSREQCIAVEWRKFSEVLDRLFFWLFLVFIMIPLVSLVGFVRLFSGSY